MDDTKFIFQTGSKTSLFASGIFAAIFLIAGMRSHAAEQGDEVFTQKLLQARLFHGPLVWVGNTPPTEAESKELWDAFGVGKYKKLDQAMPGVKAFVNSHPDSPWAPSLNANLGQYEKANGYFSMALADWQKAWDVTKDMQSSSGKQVADYAVVQWLRLLSSLGRTETMKELLMETKSRQFPPSLRRFYNDSRDAYSVMMAHPEISYRCGSYALSAVARVLGQPDAFRNIVQLPSPATGFSMAELLKVAQANHLNMAAVERPSGKELVVPSVVHWKENHYAAIIRKRGNLYEVVDPTFRMTTLLTADAINFECSGQFLVPSDQVPPGWRKISRTKMSQIFGKGWPSTFSPPPPSCGGGVSGSGGNNNNSRKPNIGHRNGGTGSPGSGGCPVCNGGGFSKPVFAGGGGSGRNSGMPDWSIAEPTIDLTVNDEPLGYQPATGPRISEHICYVQREYRPTLDTNVFGLGPNWNCSWLSYFDLNSFGVDWIDWSVATLYAPGGGVLDYYGQGLGYEGYRQFINYGTGSFMPEFNSGTGVEVVTNSAGDLISLDVVFPNGATNIYGYLVTDSYNFPIAAYLTEEMDSNGRTTTFDYYSNSSNIVRLDYIIDADGKTNTLSYTNAGGFNYLISRVVDAYHRTNTFVYDSSGYLTNLTDVMGLSTSFAYGNADGDTNHYWMTNMTTPYGPTEFAMTEPGLYDTNYNEVPGVNRSVVATEPDGSHQMAVFIAYLDGADNHVNFPSNFTDTANVPTDRPADSVWGGNTLDNPDWTISGIDDHMQHRNSFYWGRQPFANLSADFLASGATNWDFTLLTTNDYNLARLRHWNHSSDPDYQGGVGLGLSMQREPSPDSSGDITGKMTWYDYPNKQDGYWEDGTSVLPSMIVKVLPDSTEWYQIYYRDEWGNVTNMVSTYTVGSSVLTRTNLYEYYPNGIDLLLAIGPDGVTNAAYSYNTHHQVLTMTNALGEVTHYTYNSVQQLSSITRHNGLVTTNIYGSDGFLQKAVDYSVVGGSAVYYRTNSYTYVNGLVYTHTDERGLTTTNTWDNLQRLTKVTYPDGTSISYTYSNLDLVRVVDRMGFINSYTYDSVRQRTTATDPLGRVTGYAYCECGALEAVTNAFNTSDQAITQYAHDNQGNVTIVQYPDDYSVTNEYNSVRQLTSSTESGGNTITRWYNNQGFLTVVSNSVGLLHSMAYDINDRLTNSIDANTVSITNSYDNLGRLLTRGYPDGGMEHFGYTFGVSGPTSYTNQIGNVTLYGYDALNRKTNEIVVGVTTNRFAYNGAGDLLTLTDGNGHKTVWDYDQYGRVTNKWDNDNGLLFAYQYDDDNRLTNRWTPAKGDTGYAYDPVGNLTEVQYPTSPSLHFSYDLLNRLTNMVDAVGTTVYGYDAAGELLSENGPWADDTVNYSYENRLRTSLSVSAPNSSAWTQDYGYDTTRRLETVTSPAGTFTYDYDPTRLERVDQIDLPNGAYITNTYDSVARMLSTRLLNSSATVLDSESYAYNLAGQRFAETNTAGDFRNYTYDNAGQLTSAWGKEAGGSTNRWHEQFGYAYDAAGNLRFRTNNALVQTFNVNDLNELSTITRSGTLTVAGTTTSQATNVTVNTSNAFLYADATFAATNFTLVDGDNTFTAIARDSYGRTDTNSITVNLPATVNYAYDLNGNTLTNGSEVMVWNDENELVTNYVAGAWKSEFVYDGKLRRRIERDYSWNGSSWVQTNEIHFVYDGNVIIQQRDANNLPTLTLTRGNDLSGSLQGAGGIGGLLAMTENSSRTHSFYHADGNGNVTCLINTNQIVVAKAEYDPYGGFLSLSGSKAYVNSFWFSSKPIHWASGKYDYLYRWYSPGFQRWASADPKEETGFKLRRAVAIWNEPLLHRMAIQGSVWTVGSVITPSWFPLFGLSRSANEISLFTPLGNDTLSMIDPEGLSFWGDFWGWGIAGCIGGAVACSETGPGAALGAAGGFIAGAGGVTLSYCFNHPTPPNPPPAPPPYGCSTCIVNNPPAAPYNPNPPLPKPPFQLLPLSSGSPKLL